MWQEDRRAAVEERRQRSGEQLTFLAAQKELQAAAAELERQQMVVPSTVIGARASAQRLREENERAQREALRAQTAERLLFIQAEKELKAKAAEREREEMLMEYSLATKQRKALEQASRPGTPPRSVLAAGSPRRKPRTTSPRRVDPSSPSIFDRLAAEQKLDVYRKRQELLDAREAAELRDKPQLSPASQRILRRNPSNEGDPLARLSSPLRTGLKYESPRRSDELETPQFDSFKAKPMPNYDKIHMMNSFEAGCRVATLDGGGVAPNVYSPGGAAGRIGEPSGVQPGEMRHLRRQLAAIRNRGLDDSTQELVEGLLASIDSKTTGNQQDGLQRPARSRSPVGSSPRRCGRKRAHRKKNKGRQQASDRGPGRQGRASSSQHRTSEDESWDSTDDNDDDAGMSLGWEAGTDGARMEKAEYSSQAETVPLTPRGAYASLSAEKATAAGPVSPSAPFPPMEMSEETAKIICHSAKFVALHGSQFFSTLQSKHKGDPPDSPWGWISEPDSSDSKFYFAQRLEYEQEMISQASVVHGAEDIATKEPTAATAVAARAPAPVSAGNTPAPLNPQENLAAELQLQPGVEPADADAEPVHELHSQQPPSDQVQRTAQPEPAASNGGLRQSIFIPVSPEAAPWIRPLRTVPVHTSCGLPWVHIGYVEKGQPVR